MKKLIKNIYEKVPFKKQLFTLAKGFYTPNERLYKHLHFRGEFTVRADKSHSFQMRHYGYELENELFWRGLENGWEHLSVSLWTKLARDASVIVDVGANTGIYSLITKSVNRSARVFAFEPVERVFQKLEINNRLNDFDIKCFQSALSNTDGAATIYDMPTEHIYSVTVGKNINAPEVAVIPTEIKVERLDTFIERNKIEKIDLLKIDVETHEAEVLEGMGKYLDEFRPTMLIEILNDEVGEGVEALVKDKGYLYFNLNEASGSIRLVETIRKSDYYNYLLCDRKIAEDLGLLKIGF